jgi:hypothetical protein
VTLKAPLEVVQDHHLTNLPAGAHLEIDFGPKQAHHVRAILQRIGH